MSDQINWQDLEDAVGSITDDTKFAALQQTNEGGLRRLKLLSGAQIRSWFAALTQTITGLWTFSSGIVTSFLSLTSGRKFAEERSYANAQFEDGHWYTIAKSAANKTFQVISADFKINLKQHEIEFHVAFDDRGTGGGTRPRNCEYLTRPLEGNILDGYVSSARILSSETTAGQGSLVQIYISDATGFDLEVQMTKNKAYGSALGFVLVETLVEDETTLPGGDTADSFIEAGAEIQAVGGLDYLDQRISCVAVSTTVLRVTIISPEILKQDGDTITFQTGFDFVQSDGTVIATIAAGTTVAVDTAQTKSHTIVGFLSTTGLTVGENGFAFGGSVTAEIS